MSPSQIPCCVRVARRALPRARTRGRRTLAVATHLEADERVVLRRSRAEGHGAGAVSEEHADAPVLATRTLAARLASRKLSLQKDAALAGR